MDGLIAYALSKKYTDGKTSSIATGMSWKGTKENVSNLPQSGNQIGDLWHVNENGNEYAWDGSKWEALGGLDKSFTEIDPTVPAWAKQPTKPTYTAAEVGALPDSYTPPVTSVNGKTGAVVLDASDVGALPDDTVIPAAVTEQDVAGWGFTKNTGTYSKPSGGIPASDLASAVQTSLAKADTALQQHQSLAGYATETWVENKGYLTQHQDISGKQEKAITDTGNYYTTDTVEGVLQEIGGKLLPSGGSTGDFLRKTASGVAWETVPSAESNSFGGGST